MPTSARRQALPTTPRSGERSTLSKGATKWRHRSPTATLLTAQKGGENAPEGQVSPPSRHCDSRFSSVAPIAPLPRNQLASSATGGASLISPLDSLGTAEVKSVRAANTGDFIGFRIDFLLASLPLRRSPWQGFGIVSLNDFEVRRSNSQVLRRGGCPHPPAARLRPQRGSDG